MSLSDSEEFQCTPPDMRVAAENVVQNLLPVKSRALYEKMYDEFLNWRKVNRVGRVTENTMLAFFSELSKKYAPTSLWTKYSFLKATLSLKEKVDITKYTSLQTFLTRLNEKYVANKAKALTENQIITFISDAPEEYFLTKVVMTFALFGALRCDELYKLKISDVNEIPLKNTYFVQVLETKTQDRSYTIKGEYYELVKRYLSLRPSNVPTDRLFLNYQFKVCTKQPVGKNKLAKMPRQIAEFLKLPEPEKYTGHSFRHTSATVASNGGADTITLQQLGGWKSSKVAVSYVENSLFKKDQISNIISKQINTSSTPSPSTPAEVQNLKRTGDIISPNEPKKKFKFVPKKPMFPQNLHLSESSISLENLNDTIDQNLTVDIDQNVSADVDQNLSVDFDQNLPVDINENLFVNVDSNSTVNQNVAVSELILNNDVVLNNTMRAFPGNFVLNNCNVTFQMNSTN